MPPLTHVQMEALRRLSTCTVANAIETFEVRLRNAGFADSSIRCIFPDFAPIAGYAVTARIRSSVPPMQGHGYLDRTDWWNHILSIPAPRVVVVEDVDKRPGLGSLIGEVHANILLALGCVGLVTNGAVRDLGGIRAAGFQLFAGSVAVSHAYAHIFEFGCPLEVATLNVRPGDLLHGDLHGVLSVPEQVAAEIPAVAEKLLQRERKIIDICRSRDFSTEKLRAAIGEGK